MTARRPRWILEPHPDFPAPAQLAALLPDAVVLARGAPWPDVRPPAVAYGTMATLTRMLRAPALADAVFDDYAALRCSSYYRAVYDLLGRAAVVVPLVALPHLPLARWFGPRVFVRSDSNFKLFAAQVVESARERVGDFVALHAEHRDELVVVSEVVALGREYRCVVREGRVVCDSSYPNEPYRRAPPAVVAFAEDVAARLGALFTARMYTVDVAAGDDRLRLVEVGGVCSWGIYGCDPRAFIAAMEAEALARWEERGGGVSP